MKIIERYNKTDYKYKDACGCICEHFEDEELKARCDIPVTSCEDCQRKFDEEMEDRHLIQSTII